MTAKQTVLEHAPRWSEQQAQAALVAAEGPRPGQPGRRAEALRRAAALRARQSESVDAAALVREGRDELDRRLS